VIVGDVAVVVVADFSRRVRECVPYRRATAILADGAFDLIGGGGGAPSEIPREKRAKLRARRSHRRPAERLTGRRSPTPRERTHRPQQAGVA